MRLRRIPPPDDAERYFLALLAEPHPPLPPAIGELFWAGVLDLAVRHRLGEFLYVRRAATLRADWPAAARATTRRWYVENSLRNTRFHAELTRVATALREDGLAPVLLKGGALLLTVYDDPGERPFGDLDLLVRPDELEAAAAVMRRLGYRLDQAYQPESFYRAHHYHLIFRHAARPWLCFEIHWDLSLPIMDVAFNVDGLRRRAVLAKRDDLEILVPSPGDALLLLALHAGLNGFARLGLIRDVATLADTDPTELAAGDLWHAAQIGRLAVPLATSLSLARLFGGEGANRLLAARPRPWRGGLLRRILRPEIVLRQSLVRSSAGGKAAALLRRDDWAGRLAQLRRMVWPNAGILGMDGHQAAGPGGLILWARGSYGPGAPLRSAIWTALTLAGRELDPGEPGPSINRENTADRNDG
jgi:hypothetical protein